LVSGKGSGKTEINQIGPKSSKSIPIRLLSLRRSWWSTLRITQRIVSPRVSPPLRYRRLISHIWLVEFTQVCGCRHLRLSLEKYPDSIMSVLVLKNQDLLTSLVLRSQTTRNRGPETLSWPVLRIISHLRRWPATNDIKSARHANGHAPYVYGFFDNRTDSSISILLVLRLRPISLSSSIRLPIRFYPDTGGPSSGECPSSLFYFKPRFHGSSFLVASS